ncbi:hypothetical protein I546_4650 [Mycobacterium kansasii 732]|nr:hypothetical protein I546_4650 [Mycobacterium kansasii 732]
MTAMARGGIPLHRSGIRCSPRQCLVLLGSSRWETSRVRPR